ncbi:Histidyl-tRNA synthetase [hydrothermal vent metagenome]|uniref:histidine--tRNA ligase n=1 Tax=hydrothermal vent metagenome TaxID=652676 RepID=A0A3B0T265_9ZZZZ
MTKKISVPRGTSDVLPANAPAWQKLDLQSRQLFRTYNYKEIRTPIFEETALFKRSLGSTSDVVNKQLLELVSSKEEGYSLRPEGTASVVRSYLENSIDRTETLTKFFYIGPMFRGERPQKGRLRQFHQIGAEVLGSASKSPYVDADVIVLALDLLKAIGLKEYQLKINTLGKQEDKENFSRWLRDQLKENKSSLCDDCQDRFERNIFRVLDCKRSECQSYVSKLDLSGAHLSVESQEYFTQVKNLLDQLEIKYVIDPKLVRGLDYYTHTVFEITASGLGSQDAIGAGGRYNTLVEQLGGSSKESIGAIGFSLGIERILLALGEQEEGAKSSLDIFVVPMTESLQGEGFLLMHQIRSLNLSCDMSYQIGSMKSLMRQANKSGSQYVIVLGEEEIANKEFVLKNMESGEQEKILLKDINTLKEIIKPQTFNGM